MVNAVGSLNQVQRELVVGSLLGDGSLRRQNERIRKHPYFEVNHAFRYKSYVDWKYAILREYVRTPPKARRTNGARIAYRFFTRSLNVFDEFYATFYNKGKKQLPDKLELSPLTLAVWFMDDGSLCGNHNVYLNTQQFSQIEQVKLLKMLEEQWNIAAALNRDKQYFRIRIRKASADLFTSIVSPYILPIFQYKLGNDPVKTDLKREALLQTQGNTLALAI